MPKVVDRVSKPEVNSNQRFLVRHLFVSFFVGGFAFLVTVLTGASYLAGVFAYLLAGVTAVFAAAALSVKNDRDEREITSDHPRSRDFSTLPTTPSHASPISDKPNTRA